MAEIRVLYFGMLREIVGKRQEKVILDGEARLSDLIRRLSELHGNKFREFVYDRNGEPRDGIAFAADGDSIEKTRLKRTRCREVAEFAILPPISGGKCPTV